MTAERPYPDANHVLDVIYATGYAAPSTLQRKFGIPFWQAETILLNLKIHGIVNTPRGSQARTILVPRAEADRRLEITHERDTPAADTPNEHPCTKCGSCDGPPSCPNCDHTPVPRGWKVATCARCSMPILVENSFCEGEDMATCARCEYQMSQASPLTPAQLRAAVELLHEVHDEIEGTQLRTGPRQTIWLHTNSQVSDWLNQIIDNPEDLLRRDAEAEATTREDEA